jgi:hypothetical protein
MAYGLVMATQLFHELISQHYPCCYGALNSKPRVIAARVRVWEAFKNLTSNVFDRYLAHYHYFTPPKILFFTFSPHRRQRRRQQYEVFQKIFYETSFSIAKIYLSIISIQDNQKFQLIDSQHSTFTFWSHSLRKSSESSSIDKHNFSLMTQNCRFRFSRVEESISRFSTQFFSFVKSKRLKRKNFEVDDDKISSISTSFLFFWLSCLSFAFFFA